MATYARYLWGKTKVDKVKVMNYMDWASQSAAPTAATGRMYLDQYNTIQLCTDGTTYASIFQLISTTNPPYYRKGAMFLDSAYNLRLCQDASTYKTVTVT